MSETLTPLEVLKSRQNFSEYIEKHSDEITSNLLKDYPCKTVNFIIPQLTPTADGLMDTVRELNVENAYLFWFIVNEKENLLQIASKLNKMFSKSYGIFIIKAFLNDDKIDFECLLKPQIPAKQIRNLETPSKLLQKAYWEQYFEICDELQSDMQINPKPQHFAYISIGKAGVQIMQTINTTDNYIATEILINKNKDIFNNLLKNKSKIEKELNELTWHSPENIKSSKIRKTVQFELSEQKNWDKAIKQHIKMAEEFKETFSKYL